MPSTLESTAFWISVACLAGSGSLLYFSVTRCPWRPARARLDLVPEGVAGGLVGDHGEGVARVAAATPRAARRVVTLRRRRRRCRRRGRRLRRLRSRSPPLLSGIGSDSWWDGVLSGLLPAALRGQWCRAGATRGGRHRWCAPCGDCGGRSAASSATEGRGEVPVGVRAGPGGALLLAERVGSRGSFQRVRAVLSSNCPNIPSLRTTLSASSPFRGTRAARVGSSGARQTPAVSTPESDNLRDGDVPPGRPGRVRARAGRSRCTAPSCGRQPRL